MSHVASPSTLKFCKITMSRFRNPPKTRMWITQRATLILRIDVTCYRHLSRKRNAQREDKCLVRGWIFLLISAEQVGKQHVVNKHIEAATKEYNRIYQNYRSLTSISSSAKTEFCARKVRDTFILHKYFNDDTIGVHYFIKTGYRTILYFHRMY